MAMPSGNVAAPDVKDKIQGAAAPPAAAAAAVASGDVFGHLHQYGHRPPPPQQQQQQQQWFVDERDGFISWLRGEFAAANAIIDGLCQHLRAISSEPGEYEAVFGCIQQRRCNWNTVLYMQQYFPVTEVMQTLKQAAWRRQHLQQQQHHQQQHHQHRHFDPVKVGGKDYRRSGTGYRPGPRSESFREGHNSGVETSVSDSGANAAEKGEKGNEKCEERKDVVKPVDAAMANVEEEKGPVTKSFANISLKDSGSTVIVPCDDAKSEAEMTSHSSTTPSRDQNLNMKQGVDAVYKTFSANELFEGRTINVVDGLKLYESLLDDKEVKKLVSLANDLRAAGRKGQYQGHTYVASKRPMKGHGREMIQLGVPVADAPVEVENVGISRDRTIPALLQDVIERVVGMQIMTVKPDSCIIDFFNEVDHSQPHTWPHWYGRPVCVLFLTECDMTFGKVITANQPGDYKGALKLSLAPGSLLVMQGKSSDFARHAIPSLRKQRILITFTKCQPKKPTPGENRFSPPTIVQPSHWVPSSQRSFNNVPHPAGSKQFASTATANALPPPIHPPIPAPNGMQPLLLPQPVVTAIPFQAPVSIAAASAGWTAAPSRHPPPHPPVPGTGVFLPPPGSGNPSSPGHLSTNTNEINLIPETRDNGMGKLDHSPSGSPNGKSDVQIGRQEVNGSIEAQRDMANEEKNEGDDKRLSSKPSRAA
ncbi:RNA demethylase ALKBH10B isoform X2 [Eucalyptus grandis]|uniref:RNA demethylase ALKBH10B isoform X2 n=1 Tax=Eucalyptus grandis TaxID=71139 RepID=UPI00192ECF0C|nr:RNA demethylase ALKBH10B isoform X2 [Eucalyptus grandis]